MYFKLERIRKILHELKSLSQSTHLEINQVMMKEGKYLSPEEADSSPKPWIPFALIERWGVEQVHCWFRMNFTVTKELEGKTLIHTIQTSREGEWDAINPQFLIFINGKLVQGLDVNHRETLICNCAKAGDQYQIDLQGFRGTVAIPSECRNKISVLHKDIEKLYYDLKVPLDVTELLPTEDKQRIDAMEHLVKAINLLDLRKPHSESFFTSIQEASCYMDEAFYNSFCSKNDIVAKCVGHTHIDVAWLWDLDQTREKVQRSFATVLELMKHYPEYKFMSSQPQLYQFLKEERPELYEQVKNAIKEGRWEPEGAMWVEADCNLTSGESLVRQIIHGKRYFREEFQKDNKILWLPDVFGYSAALPQILKLSGIDYFMTTKISWNEYNKLPYDTFQWVGLDGSKVLTHFVTTINFDDLPEKYCTTYNGNIDAASVKGSWERYQQKQINNEVLISFGYGDGGGGPTKEMLETGRRLSKGIPGCPRVEMSTSREFFEALDANVSGDNQLPKWVGELYFEYHRGTLTSMARNKRYNRKSEYLYEEIEWLSSFAHLIGEYQYPKHAIKNGWEIICLNQFHDIIPGSSIKKVYEDSREQYERILKDGNRIKAEATQVILSKIQIKEPSIVAFNPLSFVRNGLIELEIEGVNTPFLVTDIPAKGYKVIPITQFEGTEDSLTVQQDLLENDYFRIELDSNANITSLYDKKANREVIEKGQRGNVFQAFEDIPHKYDAWDINIYYREKMWEINEVIATKIEKNTEKGILIITKRFLDSTIVQRITIYKSISRIDFDTEIDWKESHVLLKVAFPVDIHAEKATYDIQFGNVERPTHWNTSWDMAKFEVCGHKWADLSEDNYGVSILNDCKYGHDIKDGVMRLTLVKSATNPNEDADREIHKFVYSLYPHQGNWKEAGTVQMAYELNCPIYGLLGETQKGELPDTFSLIEVDQLNVIMEVVKEAEEDEDMVVRVHECYNRRTPTKVTFFRELKSVIECDLLENAIENGVEVKENTFTFVLKPYEIKTFRIR